MIIDTIKANVKVGDILYTPNRAEKIIHKISDACIAYEHGRSRVYFNMTSIVSAYEHFKGQKVSSSNLKDFDSKTFDSKQGGHTCNSIVFLMLMVKCGLTDGDIQGTGKSGNPFFINLL